MAARIEAILFPGVPYRHTVLTIPDELRIYFYRNARLLSELMRVGVRCLEDTLSTVLRRPVCGGYIVVVQTNGRSGSQTIWGGIFGVTYEKVAAQPMGVMIVS